MAKYEIYNTTVIFDMFHIGHHNILRRAKDQCGYLVVRVTTDEHSFKRQNKFPFINEKANVEAIRYVIKVVPQTDMDKIRLVVDLSADVDFVDSDRIGTEAWNN